MKVLFLSLVAMMFSMVCFGQEAVLLSEEPVVEYGTVTSATKQPLFLKFTNSGDQVLYLSESRTSFGFEVVYLPEQVAPGSIDSIGFTIDLKAIRGPFRKKISIVTNSKTGLAVFDVSGIIEN
ncbi:MAG: DUF1573 domain-containing protein [Flavobacteriaceae bacterium]